MITQKTLHCQEKNMLVQALVDTPKAGRKKAGQSTPISCNHSMNCARTTFCRFVNPLTTRNPLTAPVEETARAS